MTRTIIIRFKPEWNEIPRTDYVYDLDLSSKGDLFPMWFDLEAHVVVLTLTHRHDTVRRHRTTGSNNSEVEDCLRRRENKKHDTPDNCNKSYTTDKIVKDEMNVHSTYQIRKTHIMIRSMSRNRNRIDRKTPVVFFCGFTDHLKQALD